MMTFDRNRYVKSQTADLSKQIDNILDHRYEHENEQTESELKEPKLKETKPVSFVRSLMNGLHSHK